MPPFKPLLLAAGTALMLGLTPLASHAAEDQLSAQLEAARQEGSIWTAFALNRHLNPFKLDIDVEDAPFIAVDADWEGEGEARRILFRLNTEDVVAAGPNNMLDVQIGGDGTPRPYLHVRGGLFALDQRLAFDAGQALVLQVVATGVGGTAQQKSALAMVFQVGLHRIEAHEGRERDRIGPIALEGFNGVLLRGAADVTSLGVQDHGHLRGGAAHVRHEPLQLLFSAVRSEVRNLRLEGDGGVGRGLDDGSAEVVDAGGVALEVSGETGGVRVQAHAQQGTVHALGVAQHVEKGHGAILVGAPPRSLGALATKAPAVPA